MCLLARSRRAVGWVQISFSPCPLSLIMASRQGLLKGALAASLLHSVSHSLPSGVHRSPRVTDARVQQTVLGTFAPSALARPVCFQEAEHREVAVAGQGERVLCSFTLPCELRMWGPTARWAGFGAGVMVRGRLSLGSSCSATGSTATT